MDQIQAIISLIFTAIGGWCCFVWITCYFDLRTADKDLKRSLEFLSKDTPENEESRTHAYERCEKRKEKIYSMMRSPFHW